MAYRIIIAEVLLLSLFWFRPIDYQGSYAHIDLAQYRMMAQAAPGISSTVHAPFAYRLSVPYIVGILFPDDALGFRVLTLLFVALLTLQLFRMLRAENASESTSLLLCTVMLLHPYLSGMLFFNYFQAADALAYLLILVMLEAVSKNKLWLFGAALTVGSITRETTLLMIPVALFSPTLTSREHRRTVLLLTVPAILLSVYIRWSTPVYNSDYSLVSVLLSYAPGILTPETWGRLLLNTLAPLGVCMIVFYKETIGFFRQQRHLLLLSILFLFSTFFGGDKERLFSPVILVILMFLAREITLKSQLRSTLFTMVLLAASVVCSMHFLIATIAIPDKIVYYSAAIGAELCVGLCALWLIRRQPHNVSGEFVQ